MNNSLKIGFIIWSTNRSGGTRAIFEVANRLSGRGYKVEITSLGGDHTWFNVKVPLKYVPLPRNVNIILNLYRLAKLRRRRYDALAINSFAKKLGFRGDLIRLLAEYVPDTDYCIATYYPTALSLYLSSVRCKGIYFLQDFPELVMEYDGSYGLKLFNLTLKLPFEYFLCNSNYTKSLVEKSAKAIVTGVGIDANVFKPRNKKLVNINGKKNVMVIVRGLKFKGDEIAIKALNIVNNRIPIHAIIVGKQPIVYKIFKQIKPSFTYDLFENVNDDMLAKLYSSADVFLFTSYAESFGLPPLEAMACSTAVVTTDCMGNRDYAVDNVNSLVVPPGNPERAANAVIRILVDNNLRNKLIENGLKTAQKFTWDNVTEKFDKAIKEMHDA
jgi:glycosyltransferase involved in cell wall biosynthesis